MTSTPAANRAPSPQLARRLSLGDSISIVIGVMIGGGIFLVPNLIARNVPSAPLMMGLWVFAGAVSFIGALACAELGAAIPATGGQYVFVREAYGPFAAFLCGWSLFTVARTSQTAWLAVVFSIYLGYLVPLSSLASKLLSLAVLAIFAWANLRGVRLGAVIQNSFAFAKIAGVFLVITAALLFAHAAPHSSPLASTGVSVSSLGVALVSCLLAYDGWVQLSFVAGEIRDPQRNVVRALVLGTLSIAAIYLLANIAYLHVLSISGMAKSERVAADAVSQALGSKGGIIVSVIIIVSILGTLNGCFLTLPRVFFAQAADGLFFRSFATVHPKYGTPAFAILAQAVWSAVLLLTGSYESLIYYALFGTWTFYGLMVAGVIILRRTRPDLPRPYRMLGYPITPILFVLVTLWFLINMLVTRPVPAFAGLGFMLTGVPAYLLWQRFSTRSAQANQVPSELQMRS